MKRATLLMVVVGLVVALAATVALAANITCPNRPGNVCVGTPDDDRLRGTNRADDISGSAGNDRIFSEGGNDIANGGIGNDAVYGAGGNDRLTGALGRDLVSGGPGNDRLLGGLGGGDEVVAASGDDFVKVNGDNAPDQVFCGTGFDEAAVDLNDLIGGVQVREILSSTTSVEQEALSCEVLIISGLRVPLGAIEALPIGLEADVSRVLEEFLRDGELSPEEIRDLRDIFDLIDEGPPFTELRQLIDDLLDLLGL